MSTITSTATATPSQRKFIEDLLGDKDVRGTAYEGWVPDWSLSTKQTASKVIAFLLTLPNQPVDLGHPSEPEAGVYVSRVPGRDEAYLRVYRGQKNGRMLAKRIHFDEDGVSYEYLGLAHVAISVAVATRLSIEEVGALGVSSGVCMICGRRLDDPESVDRGIGPVCAARY
jgi:hypothetical protein